MEFLMQFLHFLESIRTTFGTTFFSFLTLFGEELVMIAIICLLYWCVDKKLSYRMSFAYFLSGLCIQNLKITFRISRPWMLDPTLSPVPGALETATGYSFPSGHTQSATAMFGSLALYFKNRVIRSLCFIFIILVGVSRMYLGVHTPKDVIVSVIVSGILVAAAGYIFRKREQAEKPGMRGVGIFVFIFLASVLTIVYAAQLLSRGEITMDYAADCCKAAGAGLGFAVGWWYEERYIQFQEKGLLVWGQAIKYMIGISIAVLLKIGLKAVLGASLPAAVIQYFILVLWVTVGYPYLIKITVNQKVEIKEC